MPLTMPSIAWSIGASSKTMFAALPPELERQVLARAGERTLEVLSDLGRAGERHLVDPRVGDERGAGE